MAKINKSLRKEFRAIKKEKKRCRKLYPDWVDDDLNCLHNQFIWGYNAYDLSPASFATLNEAQVVYNRLTKTYIMTIDIILAGAEYNRELGWMELDRLIVIEERFRTFLIENGLNEPFNLFPLTDLKLEAPTLVELYHRLHIMVEGYKKYRNF